MDSAPATWTLLVKNREFLFTILKDGTCYCFDTFEAKARRKKNWPELQPQDVELLASLGNSKAQADLNQERNDFTIHIELPPEIAQRIFKAVKNDGINRPEEDAIDTILRPYFWAQVNPRIQNPLQQFVKRQLIPIT